MKISIPILATTFTVLLVGCLWRIHLRKTNTESFTLIEEFQDSDIEDVDALKIAHKTAASDYGGFTNYVASSNDSVIRNIDTTNRIRIDRWDGLTTLTLTSDTAWHDTNKVSREWLYDGSNTIVVIYRWEETK
jgi:hypothetical protein